MTHTVWVRSTAGAGRADSAVLVELTKQPNGPDIADDVRATFEMVGDTVATADRRWSGPRVDAGLVDLAG